MNRADLRASLRDLTSLLDPDLLPDAIANSYLNEVYLWMCDRRNWPFSAAKATVSVTAGDGTIPVPADLRELHTVRVDASGASGLQRPSVLQLVSPAEGQTWPLGTLGEPHSYFVEMGEINVFPVPTTPSTATIRYAKHQDELGNDSAVPVFAASFHPAIAYGAAARVLSVREGADSDRVEACQQVFLDYMDRMEEHYLTTADQVPFQYGGRNDGWGW